MVHNHPHSSGREIKNNGGVSSRHSLSVTESKLNEEPEADFEETLCSLNRCEDEREGKQKLVPYVWQIAGARLLSVQVITASLSAASRWEGKHRRVDFNLAN